VKSRRGGTDVGVAFNPPPDEDEDEDEEGVVVSVKRGHLPQEEPGWRDGTLLVGRISPLFFEPGAGGQKGKEPADVAAVAAVAVAGAADSRLSAFLPEGEMEIGTRPALYSVDRAG